MFFFVWDAGFVCKSVVMYILWKGKISEIWTATLQPVQNPGSCEWKLLFSLFQLLPLFISEFWLQHIHNLDTFFVENKVIQIPGRHIGGYG